MQGDAMKVTVSWYTAAIEDGNGDTLGLAGTKISSELRTTDGNFAAAPDEARFCRVATDTAIHLDFSGAVSSSDDLLLAGVEYFGAREGQVVAILTA